MESTESKSTGHIIVSTEEGASASASSSVPNISVYKPQNVLVGHNNTVFIGSDPNDGDEQNSLRVALLIEILEQKSGQPQPLYYLEQELCTKLRSVTRKPVPSFKDFCKLTFRQFIERNPSHFNLKEEGNFLMVSKKKKKKKKKRKGVGHDTEQTNTSETATMAPAGTVFSQIVSTEHNQTGFSRVDRTEVEPLDEQEWQDVRPKKAHKKQITETEGGQATALSSSPPRLFELNTDECLIKDFLNKQPDNTLIFRRTHKDYQRDALLFTIDVVSLWNTPHRNRAYIILGVRVKEASLPHIPVGLTEAREDSFYQSLFRKELFTLPPKFSSREVMYQGKRIGIVQVENSRGCGFPSVVSSNDLSPGLQKDQLWARKEAKNVLISPSDFLVGPIHVWFQSTITSKEQVEVKQQPPSSKVLSSCAPSSTEQNVSGSSKEDGYGKGAKELVKALGAFQKGHFVLLCGSMRNACRNIDHLAKAPWIAVYDFDVRGRDPNGLLAILEDDIGQRRCLRVCTWCDPHTGITERGTQWWSLRGRLEVPDSQTSESSHLDWFRCVREKLDDLCIELARFCEDYTIVTMLVLWSCSEFETRCLHKFLTRMQDYFQPQIILCFTEPESAPAESMDVQMLQREFAGSVKSFHVSLSEFCTEVDLLMRSSSPPEVFEYKLPSEESRTVTITDKDAAWLAQDLDVLYLQSPHTKRALTAEDLRQEADNFFRGGAINWYARYDMGSGYLDIERSISKDVTKHIREVYIDDYKNGQVTLFHAPGSGGSTLSQRILWDLHEVAPCVQVRQRSGSSIEDIADRLIFLHDRTHVPVVAVMDGEDEARLKQLSRQLQRNCMIILYVKRYPYPMEGLRFWTESKFFLPGVVDKQESRNLVLRFTDRCLGDQTKAKALMELDKNVQEGKEHHMYEYGMTVYHHEFKGVQSYVRGYLQLPRNRKDLLPWQKCLGFLSLVYYYGQSPLPCQMFASPLGMPANNKLDLEDFPFQFKAFVVPDTIEGRGQYVRIAHYVIAKEILEQILSRNSDNTTRKNCDRLSKEARQNLKDFSIDFISQIVKRKTKTSLTAQTISYILTRTFIFRDNREVSDIETHEIHSKKPQFSQIMYDLDSEPPYNGRLEVLKKLRDTFPDDPNFRAHLGRFYTCCRPQEEEEAEKHFIDAIKLCKKRESGKTSEEIDEKSSLTLMHIYHMYGMFYLVRIAKRLGSGPGEGNIQRLTEDRFKKKLSEVVLDADRACQNFVLSRYYTPAGYEENYAYMNEIHVRLQVCDFVNRNQPLGMKEFLAERDKGLNYRFVRNSVTEIEDLIMECYNVSPPDDINYLLQRKVQWYNDLFHGCTTAIKNVDDDDELTSLRLSITAKKLEFRGSDNIVSVESPMLPEQIESLVSMLERVFKYETVYRDAPKRKLELDYKDWILAIRNPSFRQAYSLDTVLRYARNWNESVRSPLSTFYLFVLLSLRGFGSSTLPGNTDSLLEAKQLLENHLQKLSKTVIKSRFPREWLGREDLEGIRRLISSSSVGHTDDRHIRSASPRTKLAVCKGTIRAKNKKVAGFIDLDLEGKSPTVKVFYIPLFADLQGSRYEGSRVQFYLAFTLEKGYEAFEVKLLDRYRCHDCPGKVEMTLDQREVVCSCGSVIIQNEHNQVSRTATGEDE